MDLIACWSDALRTVGATAPGRTTHREADAVLARWDEPHRVYHNRVHLTEVLAALEWLAVAVPLTPLDAALARLAAWYHDAHYDVQAPERNEEVSAALARTGLARCGVSAGVIDHVSDLILATAHHDEPMGSGAAQAFQDADLAILAAPTARFNEYCAQIRSEYASVEDAEYRRVRRSILEPFLTRPRVYATDAAAQRWTNAARSNIAREIARLS